MNKHLFTALIVALTFTLPAQEISPNAIGLRLDGSDGLGPEISYQRALGGTNRLELDLGFAASEGADAFKLTGIYQWVKPLDALAPGFNWYFGVGAGVGFVDYDNRVPDFVSDEGGQVILTADGMIGIEYSFLGKGVPLQLSLDANPEIELINDFYDDFDLDIALGIRYQF